MARVGVKDHHMLVPDVPAEMELKRDQAMAIRRRCSLQEAAAALVKVLVVANASIDEAIREGNRAT